MKRKDFPQHVLQRAEAAADMAFADDGDLAAGEVAYDAVLDQWALEYYKVRPPRPAEDI